MTTTDTTRHASGCRFMTPPVPLGPRVPDASCPRCAARLEAMGWPPKSAAGPETRYDAAASKAGHTVRDAGCYDLDSIAALDREDVEIAIRVLRASIEDAIDAGGFVAVGALARVADALCEHLIDRKD